jgi:hypothetical protein
LGARNTVNLYFGKVALHKIRKTSISSPALKKQTNKQTKRNALLQTKVRDIKENEG